MTLAKRIAETIVDDNKWIGGFHVDACKFSSDIEFIIDEMLNPIRDALIAIKCIEEERSPGSSTRAENIASQSLDIMDADSKAMTDNEIIARWLGWKLDNYYPCVWYHDGLETVMLTKDFQPDKDITLWHGDDGLLKDIEKSVLRNDFLSELMKQVGVFGCPKDITAWRVLQATTAQLTAALVAVIKEEQDED